MKTQRKVNPIRLRRQALGLTIKEVAAAIGSCDSQVCDYEHGLMPPPKKRGALAKALELSEDELMALIDGRRALKVVLE